MYIYKVLLQHADKESDERFFLHSVVSLREYGFFFTNLWSSLVSRGEEERFLLSPWWTVRAGVLPQHFVFFLTNLGRA
jgi:hypothetical protein